MLNKEQLKKDLTKLIDLTEQHDEAEYLYALQMNIDYYFDKRIPPYNGEIFQDIRCPWQRKGGNDDAAEENKEAEEV